MNTRRYDGPLGRIVTDPEELAKIHEDIRERNRLQGFDISSPAGPLQSAQVYETPTATVTPVYDQVMSLTRQTNSLCQDILFLSEVLCGGLPDAEARPDALESPSVFDRMRSACTDSSINIAMATQELTRIVQTLGIEDQINNRMSYKQEVALDPGPCG